MTISLNAEPFNIEIEILDVVKNTLYGKIFRLLIRFKHYDNEDIKFSLPKGYEIHISSLEVSKLAVFLTQKSNELLCSSNNEDYDIDFSKNCFVNSEYDIEIRVDNGEYYSNEKEGILNIIIFFNINVAYKYKGASMIGLQQRISLNNLQKFIKDITSSD